MVLLDLSKEVLNNLRDVTGSSSEVFCFLGFSLNLQTGDLQDVLQQNVSSPDIKDSTIIWIKT
ncbi:MAG: hypothetical protein FWF27_04180 [Candidatus Bathyarchaeota archaeon]|nr:hypothetical protein [Candidatus Termiticorpusculum sp.]